MLCIEPTGAGHAIFSTAYRKKLRLKKLIQQCEPDAGLPGPPKGCRHRLPSKPALSERPSNSSWNPACSFMALWEKAGLRRRPWQLRTPGYIQDKIQGL